MNDNALHVKRCNLTVIVCIMADFEALRHQTEMVDIGPQTVNWSIRQV